MRGVDIFQSTRPVRGATASLAGLALILGRFQSTRPVRGATVHEEGLDGQDQISIHAPRAGRDKRAQSQDSVSADFNPRAPCGARLLSMIGVNMVWRHFNPRAPCGARPPLTAAAKSRLAFQSTRPVRGATLRAIPGFRLIRISIHAPRAGRDYALRKHSFYRVLISIHAPRAGRDVETLKIYTHLMEFQSTRPVRGATAKRMCRASKVRFQSTRPVRGATLVSLSPVRAVCRFQSTRPVRGATDGDGVDGLVGQISIHAPRAGRDRRTTPSIIDPESFQSTRPVRGATFLQAAHNVFHIISIHAPRAGRDPDPAGSRHSLRIFQSTRPVRGATRRHAAIGLILKRFQSTRPVRGATGKVPNFSMFHLTLLHKFCH